jgi:hypothetical protein
MSTENSTLMYLLDPHVPDLKFLTDFLGLHLLVPARRLTLEWLGDTFWRHTGVFE